ncbi:D-alanine--D-alanine ligase [bacterium]|nr:D-alanine--D-alanine ligase [bacterium]|tara:strand:- start:40694 stop:41596 length:903 start_codon:yes stop_codon:yes gene_type:complete
MKKIIVLGGGWSTERDVSLNSMAQTYKAIKSFHSRTEKKDIKIADNLLTLLEEDLKNILIFPCLHGRGGGEDGAIQAFLELHEIKYVGSKAKQSSLALDKVKTKKLMTSKGIPVLPQKIYDKNKKPKFKDFDNKLIVKPINEGSSIDTTLVETDEDWENLSVSKKCLVEPYIKGRELTVGVIETNKKTKPLGIIEIKPKKESFYNYKSKYTSGETEYIKKPKNLETAIRNKIKKYALDAHKALGCRSFSRSDFIIDNKNIWYLETNTIPGMTDLSLLPLSAQKAGLGFEKFLMMVLSNYE